MNDEANRPNLAAPPNPHIKLLIEFGPLAAFGVTYFTAGIFWATGVVMVTSVIALAASWSQFGRLLPAPLVTAVLVVIFGGLTFWLNDPRFIKVKPTIINLMFAGALFFGLMTGRLFLKLLLGSLPHRSIHDRLMLTGMAEVLVPDLTYVNRIQEKRVKCPSGERVPARIDSDL